MGNISQKLTYLNETKTKIREGLNSLGADLDTEDTFRSYADAIEGIYEDYPKITGEGESLSLDNTKQASMKIDYKGNTSQTGTPTPSSPIPVNVVSGDNTIDICGNNLFDKDNYNIAYGYTGGSLVLSYAGVGNRARGVWFRLEPNTTYTYTQSKLNNDTDKILGFYNGIPTTTGMIAISRKYFTSGTTNINYTFTTDSEYIYLHVKFFDANSQTGTYTFDEIIGSVQIEKGSTASSYEPYIGHSYPLYLGVENLFDGIFRQGTHVNTSTANCLCSTNEMKSVSGKQYTFYTNLPSTFKYKIMNCTANGTNTTVINDTSYSTSGSVSVNCTENGYLKILVKKNDDSDLTPSTITGYTFQVGIGTNHISSTSIELCKIGDYRDYIYKGEGKNLLDTSSMVMGDLQNDTGAEVTNTNQTHYRSDFIKVLPNTQYTFTTNYTYPSNSVTKLMEYDIDKTFIVRNASSSSNKVITFTTSNTTQYLRICMYSSTAFPNFYSLENMVAKGNNNTYEPYGAKDKWLLHKEIGKVTLSSSWNWRYSVQGN